jgi:hypothetical protein
MLKYILILSSFFVLATVHASSIDVAHQYIDSRCSVNPEKQKARSKELHDMVISDQKDRENWQNLSDEEREIVMENDLNRRKQVGQILGEGCFKTTEDYAAASLIYQHGDVPDHYYQAFIWANRAVELGDIKQKGLVAVTIDRYLVNIGKKQLFGSQAYSDTQTPCACLQPVETSFPDSLRNEYSGMTLRDRYNWLASLNQGKQCPNIECADPLQPSPKGTVPGFW